MPLDFFSRIFNSKYVNNIFRIKDTRKKIQWQFKSSHNSPMHSIETKELIICNQTEQLPSPPPSFASHPIFLWCPTVEVPTPLFDSIVDYQYRITNALIYVCSPNGSCYGFFLRCSSYPRVTNRQNLLFSGPQPDVFWYGLNGMDAQKSSCNTFSIYISCEK